MYVHACVHVILMARASGLSAGRRSSKLVSLVTSCFTANYVRQWPEYFPSTPLQCTPIFDGRAVCYPSDEILRDYLSWRQADTHINNQVKIFFLADFLTLASHPKSVPEISGALCDAVQHMFLGFGAQRQVAYRSTRASEGIL